MSASKKSRVHSGNRRVIGLSMAILAAFVISIGPLFVLQCIIFIFHGKRRPEVEKNPAISFIIGSLLVHSWGAVNPCMCFAFSENFRTGLKYVFFGVSRAGSLSLSANIKLTLARKRTRSPSSYHFTMRAVGGSKGEQFKLAAEEKELSQEQEKGNNNQEQKL